MSVAKSGIAEESGIQLSSARESEDVTIRNLTVKFPFRPYTVQQDYMGCVLDSLANAGSALLESPTGTGKTLSLLCSLLAWKNKQKEEVEYNQRRVGSGDVPAFGSASVGKVRTSTIIYASRTHSQLSQVVNELKRTVYRPRVVVLSSRENLCVNPEVRAKHERKDIRHACKALCKGRAGCGYRERVTKFAEKFAATKASGFHADPSFLATAGTGMDPEADDAQACRDNMIMDIEELVTEGKKEYVCPYFLTRESRILQEADIIFMPYNYLVERSSREGLGINWCGAVIVIDEAHNIEQQCDEAASYSLKGSDLANALRECETVFRSIQREQAPVSVNETGAASATSADPVTLGRVAQVVQGLEENLKHYTLMKSETGVGRVYPGEEVFNFFGRAEVTHASYELVHTSFKAIMDFHGKAIGLEKISKMLEGIFGGGKNSWEIANQFYNVYVEDIPVLRESGAKQSSWGSNHNMNRAINFWCFSPAVTLRELRELQVYSIILTSGTLSPLNSFASQMRMPFPVRLENDHVIEDSQIWVGVLSKGVTGKRLNSTYQNRSNPEYVTELGNTMANFARQIPDGVLVFFPSYSVMYNCVQSWKKSGIYQRINDHKKIVVEAKSSADMVFCVKEYENEVESGKGAIFFAVCRGKASEGIDFADRKARAVVITGLPYAPKNEPRVVFKQRFLDKGGVSHISNPADRLTGRDWYNQAAFRAVNQAIGRVIRHKNDFGAVIFCDDRFANQSAQAQISKWLRPRIRNCQSFGEVSKQLVQFFRVNQSKPELNRKRPSSSGRENIGSVGPSIGSNTADGKRANYLDRVAKKQQLGTKVSSNVSSSNDLSSLLKRDHVMIQYEDDITRSSRRSSSVLEDLGNRPLHEPNKVRVPLSQDWMAKSQDISVTSEKQRTRIEASEKVRQRIKEQKFEESSKKRLQERFGPSNKKRDASTFMSEVKKGLSEQAYSKFKYVLKGVKDFQAVAKSRANPSQAAEGLFGSVVNLFFEAFPADRAEDNVIEFVHFLPVSLRAMYEGVVTNLLIERLKKAKFTY